MGSKTITSEAEYATDADVDAAVRSLSEADTIRLRMIATFRARSLQGFGLGIGADDLLQEAIERTVRGGGATGAGARRWRKGVSFVKHLDQSMRSIASHCREEFEGTTIVHASQEDPDGRTDGIALLSRIPDPERLAAAREQLEKVDKKFARDDFVGLVLEGLCTGMKGREIQQALGITETQFETAMTKLRRGIDRKGGWRP
jgi:DNA-directed RNA polymerase specialized sigma24 family protein